MNPSSLALHIAHEIRKSRPDYCWQACVYRAWYFVRFREALSRGYITFSYRKEDGSIREATGTTFDLFIPEEHRPKGSSTTPPQYSTVTYYDLTCRAWRSFRLDRFIGFVTVYAFVEMRGEHLKSLKPVRVIVKKKGNKRKEAKEN